MQTLEQKYRADIASWDWDGVVKDAQSNTWENIDGGLTAGTYLGSCFALAPSGKYYTPFACSNVDTCRFCNGLGHFWVKKPQVGQAVRLHGEDMACGSCTKVDGNHVEIAFYYNRIGEVTAWGKLEPGAYLATAFQYYKTCTACGGCGSIEAYRDSVFYGVLDEIAEERGGWIQGGEGDPCDIMFCMNVENEGEEEDAVDEL